MRGQRPLASREELPADRGIAELGPKIRMGNADQQIRPSTNRLALQIHHAVLRCDVLNVSPRGNDASAGIER